MVHGAEAVLRVDVQFEAPRVIAYTEESSAEAMEDVVDLLDEIGDIALARTAVYQQTLRNYHNRSFDKGDLVLKLKQKGHQKLESLWEGPYIVTDVILGGAYRIKDAMTGLEESNPWNVAQLRQFYV